MKHPSMPRFAVSAKSVFLVLLLLFSIPALQLSAATDGDGDGIDDALDDCEFAAGNSTIDFTGCPDQDGDGNPDFIGVNYPAWNDSSRELYHSGGDSRAVTWSPDGMYIAGAGGGDVNLYWVGGLLTVLHTIDENVRALKFSPNGSYLAVGGYEEDEWENRYGWMLVLEMNWASLTATVIQNLSSMHPDTDVPSLAWSSNGSYLYTGADNEIRRFSVHDNWMMDMNYSYYSGNVWALDTSPDDRLIAGISGGGELKVYWAENGTSYMEFNNHTGSYALGLEFSPDGRWLLTGGFDNMVNIYNVSNKSLHDSIMVGSDVYGISFHPKGSHFIVARQSSSTLIYDAENWELSSSFGSFGSSNNNRGLRAVEWSPSEYAIAFGQRRDRITTYVVDEGYMQISGGELTYGLERLAMYIQGVENVYDLDWDGVPKDQGGKTYRDVFHQAELEYSTHNFEFADTEMLTRHFTDAEVECQALLTKDLVLPAYDYCLKASHLFNLLDARGVISVTERAAYIGRVRALAKGVAGAWLKSQGVEV